MTEVGQLSPAERLLWGYGVTHPEHIDLEAIARDCRVMVRYRPLGGCEARLVAGQDAGVISVNSRERSLGRKRFSLAHELAHWLCDRKSGSFQCAKSDIAPQNAEARSVEAHANGYASQLVLPTYLVDPWLAGRDPTLELAHNLAQAFAASRTAATIKMVKRSPHPVVVACYRQGRLAWHQRSPVVPAELWIRTELHHDTEAFNLTFGAPATGRRRREPARRWFSGPGVERLEVASQARGLPDGKVLALVTVLPAARGFR